MRGDVFRMPGKPGWYAMRLEPRSRRSLRRSTRVSGRREAKVIANEWLLEGERILAGFAPATGELRRLELGRHLEDFLESKRTSPKEITARHLSDLESKLRRVLVLTGWRHASEIDLDGLQRALAVLADAERRRELELDEDGRAPRGRALTARMSNSALNHYRAAWKSFARWLHRTGRADTDPLMAMERWRTEGHETFRRRALAAEEFARLFDATERSESVVDGLGGRDRAMLYLVAVSTGFRRGELATLTPRSFRMDAAAPTVTPAARATKNRKPVEQPLLPDAVDSVRGWLASKARDAALWPRLGSTDTSGMLLADAASAGLAATDATGGGWTSTPSGTPTGPG